MPLYLLFSCCDLLRKWVENSPWDWMFLFKSARGNKQANSHHLYHSSLFRSKRDFQERSFPFVHKIALTLPAVNSLGRKPIEPSNKVIELFWSDDTLAWSRFLQDFTIPNWWMSTDFACLTIGLHEIAHKGGVPLIMAITTGILLKDWAVAFK